MSFVGRTGRVAGTMEPVATERFSPAVGVMPDHLSGSRVDNNLEGKQWCRVSSDNSRYSARMLW